MRPLLSPLLLFSPEGRRIHGRQRCMEDPYTLSFHGQENPSLPPFPYFSSGHSRPAHRWTGMENADVPLPSGEKEYRLGQEIRDLPPCVMQRVVGVEDLEISPSSNSSVLMRIAGHRRSRTAKSPPPFFFTDAMRDERVIRFLPSFSPLPKEHRKNRKMCRSRASSLYVPYMN